MKFTDQAVIFLIIIVAGALLGIIFDFYRVLRGIIKPRMLVTSLTDLVYWLVATTVVSGVLLACNWGELRFYVFIGLIVGATVYYRLFSPYAITLLGGMIRVAGTLVRWIRLFMRYGVMVPLSYLLKIICWPIVLTKYPVKYVARKAVACYRTILPKPPNENM